MLFKELILIKKEWKKYLLALAVLAVIIGYFIYKGTESYIILFLSFSIPGLVVSLQSVQNSVMSEKNSGMFEKLLTVSRLDKILMLKAMVAFIFSAVVTLICSGAVFVFVSNSSSASIDSHAFLCELLISLCMDWTLSLLLVVLYTYINQIIVINGCVMALMMVMSALCFGVVSAGSMVVYTLIYCSLIIAVGCIIAVFLKFIPSVTVLK